MKYLKSFTNPNEYRWGYFFFFCIDVAMVLYKIRFSFQLGHDGKVLTLKIIKIFVNLMIDFTVFVDFNLFSFFVVLKLKFQVHWFQQQHEKVRKKRDYTSADLYSYQQRYGLLRSIAPQSRLQYRQVAEPLFFPDPFFKEQWYLVSIVSFISSLFKVQNHFFFCFFGLKETPFGVNLPFFRLLMFFNGKRSKKNSIAHTLTYSSSSYCFVFVMKKNICFHNFYWKWMK